MNKKDLVFFILGSIACVLTLDAVVAGEYLLGGLFFIIYLTLSAGLIWNPTAKPRIPTRADDLKVGDMFGFNASNCVYMVQSTFLESTVLFFVREDGTVNDGTEEEIAASNFSWCYKLLGDEELFTYLGNIND